MRVPRIRGLDKRRRPPVEETTSTFPATESPLWNRITAGVYSVGWIRGARQADDACGHVILPDSIDLNLHCIGDYERVWEGEVTAAKLQLGIVRRSRSSSKFSRRSHNEPHLINTRPAVAGEIAILRQQPSHPLPRPPRLMHGSGIVPRRVSVLATLRQQRIASGWLTRHAKCAGHRLQQSRPETSRKE
jgi:hypothetical protein